MTSLSQFFADKVRAYIGSHGAITIIDHIAYTCLSMLTLAILLQRFGLETVGLWTLLSALLNYGRIGDVWSKGLLSFIGEERGRNALSGAASYASTTVTTGAVGYLVLMTCGAVLLYGFAPQLVPPEHVDPARQTLPLMAAAYWLIACSGNISMAFVGFGVPWLKALQRIGGASLFLVGASTLDPANGLPGIVAVQLVQGAAMMLFGLAVFYGHTVRNVSHPIWDYGRFRHLFRFGSRMVLVGSVQFSIEPLIKLMVSHFGGLAAVGVLELVLRLIQGVRGVILSLSQVLITAFARQRGEADDTNHGALRVDFVQVSQSVLGGTLVAFAMLFAVGPLAAPLFLGADAQREPGALFTSMLLTFGSAWFVSSATASGHFFLMALRASRQLFATVAIRAGAILVLGLPLGLAFGLRGVMTAVLLGFALSSAFQFLAAARFLALPVFSTLSTFGRSQATSFAPFGCAFGLLIVWSLRPSTPSEDHLLLAYGLGAIFVTLLVLRFGQLPALVRAVGSLKP